MKTRTLCLLAAASTAAALVLPLWAFTMSAPQYPDETLRLQVGRTGLTGDVHEVQTLQQYIGVRFPTELPELHWAALGIGAIAGLLVGAAFAGDGRFGRAYRLLCALAFLTFLAASAADVQMRLYDVGHDRDPNAPIRAVRDFTPPLVGPVKVGNFTVWSFPHAGAFLLLAAFAMLAATVRRKADRGSARVTPRLAAAIALLGLVPANADARPWTVGGPGADFPLIAPAIAAARPGDVVSVRGGVYREDLLIDKPIRLLGVDRPVLFGTGTGSVVTITAGGVELSGFSIEGSGRGQTNGMDAGIQLTSNGNRIAGNVLRRVFYGIVVANAAWNEIVDNEVHGFQDVPFGRRGDGIYLYRAPDNVVSGNRIDGERDGVYFQYAPRGTAERNVVTGSRYGLHDMFSDDTVIAHNEFSGSAVGANIMNSRRIRLEGNLIRGNRGIPGVGLTLKDCDDSSVTGNRIVENARGLLLEGSSVNRFSGNIFAANDTAVTLFSSAERNAFGGNSFDGNWSDVVLSGRDSDTAWSIDGRGNYWSRYQGFDFDGDGVGESPHPVTGAFERIEGRNPAARIFLQSPAAAGLALAERLRGTAASDALDRRPLVTAPCAGNRRSPC